LRFSTGGCRYPGFIAVVASIDGDTATKALRPVGAARTVRIAARRNSVGRVGHALRTGGPGWHATQALFRPAPAARRRQARWRALRQQGSPRAPARRAQLSLQQAQQHSPQEPPSSRRQALWYAASARRQPLSSPPPAPAGRLHCRHYSPHAGQGLPGGPAGPGGRLPGAPALYGARWLSPPWPHGCGRAGALLLASGCAGSLWLECARKLLQTGRTISGQHEFKSVQVAPYYTKRVPFLSNRKRAQQGKRL